MVPETSMKEGVRKPKGDEEWASGTSIGWEGDGKASFNVGRVLVREMKTYAREGRARECIYLECWPGDEKFAG